MTHRTQPAGSNSCGQHCIAMIVGIDPSEIIELMGSGKTKTSQLIKALNFHGRKTAPRLIRGLGILDTDKTAICKVRWIAASHWIVYHNKKFYDPGLGAPVDSSEYLEFIKSLGHITSYLEIKN